MDYCFYYLVWFVSFFFWQRAEWGHLTLQAPASEHGVLIDQLWDTTMGLIIVVFLVLQPSFIWFFLISIEEEKIERLIL